MAEEYVDKSKLPGASPGARSPSENTARLTAGSTPPTPKLTETKPSLEPTPPPAKAQEMDKTVKLTAGEPLKMADTDKTVKLTADSDKTVKLTPDTDKTMKLTPDASSPPAMEKPMIPPPPPPPPMMPQKKSKKFLKLLTVCLLLLLLPLLWFFLPLWLVSRAQKFSKEGKYAEAAKQIQWALALFPVGRDSYLVAWGRELRRAKDFAMSQKALEEVMQKNPNHLQAQRELGQTFNEAGQKEKALELFQKVLAQKADDMELLQWTGMVAFELKKFDLAASAYEKYVQQGTPGAKDYYELGASYYELEKLDEAEESLRKGWEKNKAQKGIARLLGKIQLAKANYAEAAAQLKTELSLSPEDAVVKEEFAQASLEGGKHFMGEKKLKEAQKFLEEGLTVSTKYNAELHYQLAIVFAKNRKQNECFNHLKEAFSANDSLKKNALSEPAFSAYRKLPAFLKLLR